MSRSLDWLIRALRASGNCTDCTAPTMSPNTVPWPQPVVTTRDAVLRSKSSMPARVRTATALTSQSTVIECTSSTPATRRWLRR